MKKRIFIFGFVLIVIGIILAFVCQAKVIKLKSVDDTKFKNTKMNNNTAYSYTITKNKSQFKDITNKSDITINFKKYDYMVLEIDRGASCNADIDIVNVDEKKTSINIDIKLYNIAPGCSVSTPKYFAIPISKKYKSNLEVILNETGD